MAVTVAVTVAGGRALLDVTLTSSQLNAIEVVFLERLLQLWVSAPYD